jgi:uncharacterized membrane protein YhaH (DUF805 family)
VPAVGAGPGAPARRLRAIGWAALFPVVMLVSFVCWGVHPWIWTMFLVAVTVTLLAPAVAADLLVRGSARSSR